MVPSRQVVIYFSLPADQRAIWARSPMVIDKTGDVGLYLCRRPKAAASRSATTSSAGPATHRPSAGA